MRASSLLATLMIGVVCAATTARASETTKKSTPGAAPKTAAAPPAKTVSSAKETKPDDSAKAHSPPESRTSPPASHGTPSAAAHGGTAASKETTAAGAPKQGTVTVAATADAPKQETLEEIVARVRRRLAMERAPKRGGAASAAGRSPAAAHVEVPPRVSLVWRPYIVWPDELTGTSTESAPSSDTDRVTLKWEADQR